MTRGRRHRSAPIAAIVLLGSLFASGAPRADERPPGESLYLEQLRSERDEGWFQGEVRRFTTYPYIDRALRLLDAGDVRGALGELERYLENDPDDLRVRLSYLLLLYREKIYPRVIRQATILLEKRPGYVPALLYRGLAHQALGQVAEAIADFRGAADAADVAPADREFALRMIADLGIAREKQEEALEALDDLAEAGTAFDVELRRGLALEKLARFDEAAAAYRKAADLAPGPAEALRASRAYAEAARKGGDLEGARRALVTAHELAPGDVDVLRALADVSYAAGDLPATARWLEKAVKVSPDPELREFLASVLASLEDYPEAIDKLEALLATTETPAERHRIHMALGNLHARLGNFDESAAAFREAAETEDSAAARLALAYATERAGNLDAAIRHFEEVLREEPSAQTRLELALLQLRAGRKNAAVPNLERAVAGDLPKSQKALAWKQLGFLHDEAGRDREALHAMQRALDLDPDDRTLLGSLGMLALRAGALEAAAGYLERSLASQRSPRAETLENLGFIYARLGQHEKGADYLERAIAAGRDGKSIRENLGLILFRAGKWEAAVEQFERAHELGETPRSLAYLGRSYEKLGKPGVAVHYLRLATNRASELEEDERKALYDALGYLYAAEAQYQQAVDAWTRSLEIRKDAEIEIRLGNALLLSGRLEEARRALEAANPEALDPELRAERLAGLGRIHRAEGRASAAATSLAEATRLTATPDRHYQLGLARQELGDTEAAIVSFEAAVAGDPDTTRYREALGQAYRGAGRHEEAIRELEHVVAENPDYLALYEELGYLEMRVADNAAAKKRFRQVIDNEPLYPVHDEEDAHELDERQTRARKEIRKLDNTIDLTAYLSLRAEDLGDVGTPAGFAGGALASQGGTELAWRPPVIGLRDERVFQVFGRVLWDVEPDSVELEEDSFQGGVGLRYKPFRPVNFYLSGERLVEIGDDAIDNWLLRALVSWSRGRDLEPERPWWSYTTLYGDVGYLVEEPDAWLYYAEGRQGLTLNLDDRLLVTPHAVADVRYEDPFRERNSYFEYGGGLSLRLLFNETHYSLPASSLELLVQYKGGQFFGRDFDVQGDSFDGWVLTTVLSY